MNKSLAAVLFGVLGAGLILNQGAFAQPASGPAQPAASPAVAQPPEAAPSVAPAPPAAPAAPAAAASPAAAPSSAAETPRFHGIGAATILTLHGKIAAMNRSKRLVTLLGPDGNKVTFKVSKSANLDALKVGDAFAAHFFESVHIRRKRPGEVIPAVSIKEGISSAKPGQTPAGVYHTKSKVLLKVSAVDPKAGTITVTDPDGTEETVKVGNSRYLSKVKAGDELVVTVRQAVAISLEKD
jgi:hypothetical protein